MKILMLAPLPPPSGGIATWTIRYQKYCNEKNIDLRIVNIAMSGDRATHEIMRRNFKVEFQRTKYILRNLKKELKNDTPDIVHINTSCSKFGIIRDCLCAFIIHKKAPIVLHCHCNIEDQVQKKISKLFFKYLVKKADKVIVLNKFSKEYVEKIEKKKSVFIPNFVNEQMINADHMINDKINEIVYVGHIEREKGIVQIVEAAKLLPNINFKLVGAVREDISDIKIPSNVLLVGRVEVEKVQKYLKEADVFLFPSKSEGFSNALLEAMAMGLPIIASDVGANSIMIEKYGGIILKDNTGEAICDAVNQISNYNKRKKMSNWNIEKVKRTYVISIVMNEYFTLYEKVYEEG